MKPVTVRNLTIGAGMPKICVPLVGMTEKEIVNEAKSIKNLPVDLVEWRADWFEYVFDKEKVMAVLQSLREELDDMPILFTFRTKNEGGEKEIDITIYEELLLSVAQSGYVDLVDVEVFMDDCTKTLIEKIHTTEAKVVGSNHDFSKTPSKEEIIRRLRFMQEIDADIPKIAVMPQCKEDVQILMDATKEMSQEYAERPIVTMSMGEVGRESRIKGEVFGSAVTFGSLKKASAPGQIEVSELKKMLEETHKAL